MSHFPFGIMDIVKLLKLNVRRTLADSIYVDCLFCGDTRGKMNINFAKNVWRCNYCGEHGGMLELYAKHCQTAFQVTFHLKDLSNHQEHQCRMYTKHIRSFLSCSLLHQSIESI